MVVKDDQQLGPFTPEEINSQLAGGMLDPTDLGWVDGYETWVPLSSMAGLVMPGVQGSTEVDPISEDGAESTPIGLKTAGEGTVMSPHGGKWKWVAVSVFVVAGVFGAYQFVFGKGDIRFPDLRECINHISVVGCID